MCVNGVCQRIEFSWRKDLRYTRAIHYYCYWDEWHRRRDKADNWWWALVWSCTGACLLDTSHWHCVRLFEPLYVRRRQCRVNWELAGWRFEPSQPQRITSGLSKLRWLNGNQHTPFTRLFQPLPRHRLFLFSPVLELRWISKKINTYPCRLSWYPLICRKWAPFF